MIQQRAKTFKTVKNRQISMYQGVRHNVSFGFFWIATAGSSNSVCGRVSDVVPQLDSKTRASLQLILISLSSHTRDVGS